MERMEKLVSLMNRKKPVGPLRAQGDLVLLQNPPDLEEVGRWLYNLELYLTNSTVLNAVESEEVPMLKKNITEARNSNQKKVSPITRFS